MNSLAMQLGLSPLPTKTVTGTVHTADGHEPRQVNRRADRKEAIAARRASILAICKSEATMSQMKSALGLKEGTLAADLRAMVGEGTLRMIKRKNVVHWEAA